MMIFEKSDEKNLNKLGVSTLLDLALIIPYSYEDTTILKNPQNTEGVVEVVIKSNTKRANTFFVTCYCITWNLPINLVIFNAKMFHFAIFKPSKQIFVLGKIEYSYGKWQMIQPKVVTKIGIKTAKYKTPLKNISVINLMKKYITQENLMLCPLTFDEIKFILAIHIECEKRYFREENLRQRAYFFLKHIEICNYLLKLSKKKVKFPSSAILDSDESKFIKSLPFSLTNDQQKAIKDIKEDLRSDIASKRIIMGDVGCGKTIVILASVCISCPKKAVLMVPTTILAVQIFEEARKYLKVKIALVTGGENDEDLSSYDFIIGTHALLYRKLPHCDLVMIDEQHRFGTQQRKMIHKLVSKDEKHPHFLQFTATPIPRTLSLINSSIIKYSFIKELPFKKDIKSLILKKENFNELLKHIDEEISKKHQVAIIYPLVEKSDANIYQSLDEGRVFWEKRYKNVYLTHGKDKEKEENLRLFKEQGDILLATTVVEVGISLPRLTTMVIVGAERLGLATLHQLRGRVSRTGLKGYCFLFTYKEKVERLDEFIKTKDGFEIAELDLKYRQGGDLLIGTMQHGEQFKFFDLKTDEEILKNIKGRIGI